jgi:hypothetical protein
MGVISWLIGTSWWMRIILAAGAAWAALLANNQYQQWKGGEKRAAEIAEEAKKDGEKKLSKVRKRRARIKPNTAWNRLLKEYAHPD